MTLQQALDKVIANAPSHYAKIYAKAMPQAIAEAQKMGLSAEYGQKTQINYILSNLEDFPTENLQCLDCHKIIIRDSDDYEYLLQNDQCPKCGSMNTDMEYASWDSPEGKEVIETLKHYSKELSE